MNLTPATLSMMVIKSYKDTLFIRLSPELQRDIDGGCVCHYCKAHPELTPKWDTLAVGTKSAKRMNHTWTVHMPSIEGMK